MGGLIGPALSALSAGEAVAFLPEAVQATTATRPIRTVRAGTRPGAAAPTPPPAKGRSPLLLAGAVLVGYYVLTQGQAPAGAPGISAATPVQVPTAPPIARPGTPVSLTQVNSDTHSVTMTWSQVSGAVSYQVWQFQPRTLLASVEANTAVIGSLQANTHYEVFVIAIGATGLQSPPSAPLLITTQTSAPAATVPSIPMALTVTATTATSVSFEWAAAAGATYYQIINETTGQVSAPIQGTSANLAGLSPGQTYTFALQACNDIGCSNPSSLTVATTTVGFAVSPPSPGPTSAGYAPPPAVPTPAAPTPPVAVPMPPQAPQFIGSVATSAQAANLTIGWPVVPGAAYYQVVHSTGAILAQTQQSIATLSGLAPGAVIHLYVRACNASGCSAPSALGSFQTASLGSPTHVVSAQTGLAAVVPIGVSNPAAIAAASIAQQEAVPAGYPFASFAQAQEAVNWWALTHPGQGVPTLTALAPLWRAAGAPAA